MLKMAVPLSSLHFSRHPASFTREGTPRLSDELRIRKRVGHPGQHTSPPLHWPSQVHGRAFVATGKNSDAVSRRLVYARFEEDFTSFEPASDVEGSQSDSPVADETERLDLGVLEQDGDASSPMELEVSSSKEGTVKGMINGASELQSLGPKTRVGAGFWIAALLFLSSCGTLLLIDSYIWRVIRKPLAAFYLTYPFLLSTVLTGYLGYLSVPFLKRIKASQIFREEIKASHVSKVGIPTMGGLFFVPVGIGVARFVTGFVSDEVWGVAVATLAFAAIGLLDDGLTAWRSVKYGLPGWMKFVLQLACGAWFAFWLNSSTLPSPYKMRTIVPLPAPLGLWYAGKWYLPLTVFCFASMSNGVNLTDGLDGLAAGTAAIAFIAMSIAVLPIYPALGVFGTSMAGACMGFLVHNRHKASVFMGDTGSLALGAALAAMAACTGMFLPLFIASGVFVVETLSVVGQVAYFKLTRKLYGKGRRWLRMAPFHHHLELLGVKEPVIVMCAYAIAFVHGIVAAYVALISA